MIRPPPRSAPFPATTRFRSSRPRAAAEAAAKMRLPPGFNAAVFAAEPDVQNPIAMGFCTSGSAAKTAALKPGGSRIFAAASAAALGLEERKRVVAGKGADLGGGRIIHKKKGE